MSQTLHGTGISSHPVLCLASRQRRRLHGAGHTHGSGCPSKLRKGDPQIDPVLPETIRAWPHGYYSRLYMDTTQFEAPGPTPSLSLDPPICRLRCSTAFPRHPSLKMSLALQVIKLLEAEGLTGAQWLDQTPKEERGSTRADGLVGCVAGDGRRTGGRGVGSKGVRLDGNVGSWWGFGGGVEEHEGE